MAVLYSSTDTSYDNGCYGFQLALEIVEEYADIAANTSVVSYTLTLSNPGHRYNLYRTQPLLVTLRIGSLDLSDNVSDWYFGWSKINNEFVKTPDGPWSKTVLSGELEIEHNEDGTCNLDVYAKVPKLLEKWSAEESVELSGGVALTAMPPQITFNYYSNGATIWNGTGISPLQQTLVRTWIVTPTTPNLEHENHYNFSGVGISKPFYNGNYWGTTPSGGTLMEQDELFTSYEDLCSIYGVSSSGRQSVDLYAQWSPNKIIVEYYSNYATSAFDGALNQVGSDRNVKIHEWTITPDMSYPDNLHNYVAIDDGGASTRLDREGYVGTGYWGTEAAGGRLIYQDEWFNNYEEACDNLGVDTTSPITTIQLYAQWRRATFKLTFNSNEGTNTPGDNFALQDPPTGYGESESWVTVTYHKPSFTTMAGNIPTRDGYRFLGWFSSPIDGYRVYTELGIAVAVDGSEYWQRVMSEPEGEIVGWIGLEDMTVYAQWERILSAIMYVRDDTTWHRGSVHVRPDEEWKSATAVYAEVNDDWKSSV